jgi:microtubule-associated protein-like 6
MAAKGKAKAIDCHVWDADSKASCVNMNKFHLRAITNLAFSPDGTKLVSIGRDDDNSLAIHEW